MVFAFGEHVLQVKRRELWRGGKLVALEPQVFDLLLYLVEHRDRVVDRDDLLQAVWGGRIVSESALTTRINAARRAVGDNGASQQLIRTLPKKGFRFIAEVQETPDDVCSADAATSGAVTRETSRLMHERPAMAVLPLSNIGGGEEQESFAEGMAEEIITALSRIRWLVVIARSASSGCKGRLADARRVGRELGVRYILDGSVRRSGDRVRVTVQLVDAETAAHLWADRFDGTFGDVIELQERVATAIAGMVEPLVEALEVHRSAGRPMNELTAHDCYLRALPGCYSCNLQSLLPALALLDHAIERDPGFGPALATAAGCRQFLGVSGWAEDPGENRRQAVELAHRALQADGHDPIVLTEAARVRGYFTEEIRSAIAMIERALAFNPSYARGWYWNGWIRLFAGQPEPALEHFHTALRLNPRHRPYMTGLGAAHFFSRRYREAAEALVASLDELPGWPTTYRFLAASYAHLGKLDKARETIDHLRAITPVVLPSADCAGSSPFRDPKQAALYAEGLRAAAGAACLSARGAFVLGANRRIG